MKYIKFLFVLVILIPLTLFLPKVYINHTVYKNSSNLESIKDKDVFKNRIVEDVVNEFEETFGNSKFDISKFEIQDLDGNIYLFSQLFGYKEAYFIIQYNGLDVSSISFQFNDVNKSNLDDIIEIISLLIKLSDNNITNEEAKKIVINMFKEFNNSNYSVNLSYINNVTYTLNIINNNSLKFYMR